MPYPTTIDSLNDPAGSNYLNSPSHSELHTAENTAIEALQAKLGVDDSAVATSIDYFLKHASGRFRAHVHDGGADDAAKLDWDNCFSDAVHSHASNAEGGTLDVDNCFSDFVHTHASDGEGGTIPEANIVFNAAGHDHSGTTAGNLIPTAGIEDSAVATAKIAAGAVTAPKIDINLGARAYLSADQDNLVFGAWTKVLLDTENYDLGSNFASNKFTVPTGGDGTYIVMGSVTFEGTELVADRSYASGIYVNGAQVKQEQSIFATPSTVRDFSVPIMDILRLSATDYVELYAMSYSGGNLTDIQSGTTLTFMAIQNLGI